MNDVPPTVDPMNPAWQIRVDRACRQGGGQRIGSADRLFLESVILQGLYEDRSVGSVLFVGCRSYTAWYGALFEDRYDLAFETVDPHPEAARCLGDRHFPNTLQELAASSERDAAYDVLILNGVFGYGTDTLAEKLEALKAADRLLKPGGRLVIGFNRERDVEPELAQRLGCAGVSHICTFDPALMDPECFQTTPLPGFTLPYAPFEGSGRHAFIGYRKA